MIASGAIASTFRADDVAVVGYAPARVDITRLGIVGRSCPVMAGPTERLPGCLLFQLRAAPPSDRWWPARRLARQSAIGDDDVDALAGHRLVGPVAQSGSPPAEAFGATRGR